MYKADIQIQEKKEKLTNKKGPLTAGAFRFIIGTVSDAITEIIE